MRATTGGRSTAGRQLVARCTELVRLLTDSDAHNGFANRFAWICVRRSKVLPFGGEWEIANMAAILRLLGEALRFAKNAGEIRWGESAKCLWVERYEALSEGSPGLFGAVTSRSEAQVVRLAMVYALMEGRPTIEEPHLKAALAVWDYAEASARYIFGNATGDPVADRIQEALAETPYGLTRTEISDLFARNQPSRRVEDALALLCGFGRVRMEESTGRGRPTQRWYAT